MSDSYNALFAALQSAANPESVHLNSDRFNCGKHADILFKEFFDVPFGHENWQYGLWMVSLDQTDIKSPKLLADIGNLTKFLAVRLSVELPREATVIF